MIADTRAPVVKTWLVGGIDHQLPRAKRVAYRHSTIKWTLGLTSPVNLKGHSNSRRQPSFVSEGAVMLRRSPS